MTDTLMKLQAEVQRLVQDGRKLVKAGTQSWSQNDDAKYAEFVTRYQAWYRTGLTILMQNKSISLDEYRDHYDDKRLGFTLNMYGLCSDLPSLSCGGTAKTIEFRVNAQTNLIGALPKELEARELELSTAIGYEYVDDEYGQAQELLEAGFLRAAGVIAGVALERHLHVLADKHGVKVTKNPPSKSKAGFFDYLVSLKNAFVINEVQSSLLEAFYKVRTQCAHAEEEPTKADIERLIKEGRRAAVQLN